MKRKKRNITNKVKKVKNAKNMKKKTATSAILLVILSSVFTSIGQIFLKVGVQSITSISSIINFHLITGLFLFGIALLLLLQAYKNGELSVLYPIIALEYIWVVLLSNFLLGEAINNFKILGVVAIMIGVTLIGVGGRK